MNDLPPRVVPGRAEIQGLKLLESCSFRWIFDGATNRFRRTPRDATVWSESLADWTEYHHLEIDEARSCFVVGLDEERTRFVPSTNGARQPLRAFGGWGMSRVHPVTMDGRGSGRG